MESPEQRLEQLGVVLPGPLPTVGAYVPAKSHGDLVFVSGHGPFDLDRLAAKPGEPVTPEQALGALIQGKVGAEVSESEAVEAARAIGVLMLASLRAEIGSLDRVASILKLVGMVNCAPGFTNMAAVIDGCSGLLLEAFGEEVGRHARSAPGVAELPLNVPVVVEMVVAVRAD